MCHCAVSSCFLGKRMAAAADIATVRIMVRVPLERPDRAGRYVAAALAAKQKRTIPQMTRS